MAPARTSPRRWIGSVAVLLAALAMNACERSAPTAPSPSPEPVAPTTVVFTLSGSVRGGEAAAPLAGARIEIVEGEATGRLATSDDQGRYHIDDLPAGSYAVRAAADGFTPTTNTVALERDAVVDFTLAPAAGGPGGPGTPPEVSERFTIEGTTVDAATGEPLDNVRVEVMAGVNSGRAVTSEAGRWTLADLDPGPVTVLGSIDGYAPAQAALTLDSDTELELRLERARDPDPPGPSLTGQVVDAVTRVPLADVRIRVAGGGEATSGSDGRFTVTAQDGGDFVQLTLSSPEVVERTTQVRPDEPGVISLIPHGFDLVSFDEMFRNRGGLHRWLTAPRLIVQRRVLEFAGTDAMEYVAGEAIMGEEEVAALVADLEWALPQLTGGTFVAFAAVDVMSADPGATVPVAHEGAIFVARYEGLTDALGAWGYGRWAWTPSGEVRRGAVMLDDTFENSGSGYRRSLRAHELGHALGYDHVSATTSVMHVTGRLEPTSFDHEASRVAFQRPPLNRSPDVDPSPSTLSRVPGGLTWAGER